MSESALKDVLGRLTQQSPAPIGPIPVVAPPSPLAPSPTMAPVSAAASPSTVASPPPSGPASPASTAAQPEAYAAPANPTLSATAPTEKMGERFVRAGLLTEEQVQRVVALQQAERLRFGQAAVRLGFVSEERVHAVLAEQYNYAATMTGQSQPGITLAIAAEPFSNEAEAIRQLRAQISIQMEGAARMVIAVVSPGEHEGRSYLAASLAVAFAQTGRRTLLVNANLRAGGQGDILGRPQGTGLSGVLSGRAQSAHPRAVAGFPTLAVLDAGPQPPNPSELLREPALAQCLVSYADRYEIFLIDTPPAGQASETQSIVRQADACLMVARRDVTELADLEHATNLLQSSGARMLGIVFNEYRVDVRPTMATRAMARIRALWPGRR